MKGMTTSAGKPSSYNSAVPNDDCDILYEKMINNNHPKPRTMRNLETPESISAELSSSQYPSYAAQELALFHELQSGVEQYSGNAKMPEPIEINTKGLKPEILGKGEQANITDHEDESKDCEILFVKSPESAESGAEKDLKPQYYVFPQHLVKNSNFDAAFEKAKDKSKNVEQRKSTKTSSYRCKVCRVSVSSEMAFKIHLSNHVRETESPAQIYNKSISALRKLNNRDRKLKGQTCQYCSQKCRGIADLRYHMNTMHADIRPYQCQLCTKNYTRSNHLVRHELTHRKES